MRTVSQEKEFVLDLPAVSDALSSGTTPARRTGPIDVEMVRVGEQEGGLPNSPVAKSMKFTIKMSADSGIQEL